VDISVCLDAARSWPDLRELASAADERGMYAVYVPDHVLGYREAWTLLRAIAVSTERIRVGTLVLGVTHRHVAVLREMARTLGEVSGGRLLLGLGASGDEAEHRSLGLAFPPPGERLDILESAAEQLANDGRSLLIGVAGERRTMPIAARYASAWHTWAEPDTFQNKCAVMDRLCGEAGREPPNTAISSRSGSSRWSSVLAVTSKNAFPAPHRNRSAAAASTAGAALARTNGTPATSPPSASAPASPASSGAVTGHANKIGHPPGRSDLGVGHWRQAAGYFGLRPAHAASRS
jgi:hypothetical protein